MVNGITALCSHQLPAGYFSKLTVLLIGDCGKLRNLMPPSVAKGLVNIESLEITGCPSMEVVIREEEEEQQGEDIVTKESLFPRLEKLKLCNLPKLGHFSLARRAFEFPSLKEVWIKYCPEMKTFVLWPVSTPSLCSLAVEKEIEDAEVKDGLNKAIQHMFNSKVFYPSLEILKLKNADGITALCSHQLPAGYFSKLTVLLILDCGKLRNLMPPSAPKGLVNIRRLEITGCPSMEVVITEEEEEQQGEDIMTKESLFPRLERLKLYNLPKLGHFFLTRRALEFPSLEGVRIKGCPEMKTFVLGSVSTPNLCSLALEKEIEDAEVKDDLNKAIQHLFNTKKQQSTYGDDSPDGYDSTDGDESEASD